MISSSDLLFIVPKVLRKRLITIVDSPNGPEISRGRPGDVTTLHLAASYSQCTLQPRSTFPLLDSYRELSRFVRRLALIIEKYKATVTRNSMPSFTSSFLTTLFRLPDFLSANLMLVKSDIEYTLRYWIWIENEKTILSWNSISEWDLDS